MDQLIRAITKDGMVKATALTTRDMTERARQIHKTLPVATAALGRTLAAASMMGNALKGDGASLTIQIRGGGPLGAIVVVSDNEGNVRGYVEHPDVDIPLRSDGKLDVGTAVGADGTLTVIKDLNLKEPYVGCCAAAGRRDRRGYSPVLRGERADPHRLCAGRSGGPGSERALRGRLSDPAAARRGRRCDFQGGGGRIWPRAP